MLNWNPEEALKSKLAKDGHKKKMRLNKGDWRYVCWPSISVKYWNSSSYLFLHAKRPKDLSLNNKNKLSWKAKVLMWMMAHNAVTYSGMWVSMAWQPVPCSHIKAELTINTPYSATSSPPPQKETRQENPQLPPSFSVLTYMQL